MTKTAFLLVLLQAALLGQGPINQADRTRREGNLAASQLYLEQALLDYPALSGEIRLRQAQTYLLIDSVERAEGLWREAVGRLKGRDQAQAYCNLGVALYRRGKAGEALAALRLALIAYPDHELSRRNFELILRRLPPEPPEPPPPPPIPPPQKPLPQETAGAEAQMPELSRAEALEAVQKIAKRERPYLQQNRKVVKSRRPQGPPW